MKFVNSTAKQVRYAHLESKHGMAPVLHTKAPIVYDRDAATTVEENEFEAARSSGRSQMNLRSNNKPGTNKDNAVPLWFHPIEPIDEH